MIPFSSRCVDFFYKGSEWSELRGNTVSVPYNQQLELVALQHSQIVYSNKHSIEQNSEVEATFPQLFSSFLLFLVVILMNNQATHPLTIHNKLFIHSLQQQVLLSTTMILIILLLSFLNQASTGDNQLTDLVEIHSSNPNHHHSKQSLHPSLSRQSLLTIHFSIPENAYDNQYITARITLDHLSIH